MRKCVIILVVLCSSILSKAQQLHTGIRVIARSYGDSVVLRWAPMKSWAWHKLNTLGYRIERIDLSEKDNPKREWLTPAAIKPYTLDKLKATFSSDNANAAVAAQCLYGKNFETNLRQGQAGIADKSNVTETRYAFTLQSADFDAGVAVAVALRFCDRQVKKGGRYIYRVMPGAGLTQGVVDTGSVLVVNAPAAGGTAPKINEAIAADRIAELHWDRMGADNWSGYFIERSVDGGSFSTLNKLPFITSRPDSAFLKEDSTKARAYALLQTQHVFIDSLPQNYRSYTYRIRGINAFAEKSGYSNTVAVSGRDLTPPVPVNMLNPQFVGGRKIKVPWSKELIEKDCKGYYITRSKNINGPYVTLNRELLAPGSTAFIDDSAFAHGRNFYMVVSVDTAGNISSSVPAMGLVPDETAPAAPAGLRGRIDRLGLVHLSWDRGAEEDIRGYKVYFANAEGHVFSQITTEPDTLNSFVDSINLHTLTKDIWYKVVAVDYNNNHSAFSAVVRLRKPDLVPPMPPVATHVVVGRNSIDIDWVHSSSNDVVRYQLYRQSGDGSRVGISSFRHDPALTAFHFTDTSARPNVNYIYSAEAVDEDSLHSPASVAVQARISAVVERPAITGLKAVYDEKTKVVRLSWQYAAGGDYFFIVYRGVGNEVLQRLRSLGKEDAQFMDGATSPGKKYRYAIQAVYRDGKGNTRMGEEDEVTITQGTPSRSHL
jgi:fibronectin type 3 domain-containing protein